MKLDPGIYSICHIPTGRHYVGSTHKLEWRWRIHRSTLKYKKHANRYLQRAWNKYPNGEFSFTVLCRCKVGQLLKKEQEFIDKLDAFENGFNLAPVAGSIRGLKMSEEAKAKRRGRVVTKAMRRKISVTLRGHSVSAATREKISEGCKGTNLGNKHAVGTSNSPAARRRTSARMKGNKFAVGTKWTEARRELMMEVVKRPNAGQFKKGHRSTR